MAAGSEAVDEPLAELSSGRADDAVDPAADGSVVTDVPPQPVEPDRDPPVQGGDQIRAIIAQYDWPLDQALAVAACESRFNPMATGSAGERGIYQIHPVHAGAFDWSRAYEPEVNIAYAYKLWRGSGWKPWTCAKGTY